jgi:beta-glucosidase
VEPSGAACDHYHRYPADIAMLASFGLRAYRFSIEWARVEPEEGEFSGAQLDHYKHMCETCIENDVAPIVTFHHFTSPRWVARAGGWSDDGIVDRFARYCDRVAAHLGGNVEWACTINEPNIVALMGHLVGIFPPGHHDPEERLRVNDNFIAAHHKAVAAIKAHIDAPVGMTLAMSEYQAVDGGEIHVEEIRRPMEDVFLDAARGDDFIGVQTYSRTRVSPAGILPPENPGSTQMFYDFYPEALEHTIKRAWEVTGGVPVLVSENGIATDDDGKRVAYVEAALNGVVKCLADGVDVRGYCYWSLLDNFEWALGYQPTFGLVAVDRATFARSPKPSARWLGRIAEANRLL